MEGTTQGTYRPPHPFATEAVGQGSGQMGDKGLQALGQGIQAGAAVIAGGMV